MPLVVLLIGKITRYEYEPVVAERNGIADPAGPAKAVTIKMGGLFLDREGLLGLATEDERREIERLDRAHDGSSDDDEASILRTIADRHVQSYGDITDIIFSANSWSVASKSGPIWEAFDRRHRHISLWVIREGGAEGLY